MKKLASLTLYFSLSYVIIILAASFTRYIALKVEWAQSIPQRPETFLNILIQSVGWAISMATYLSIILTLSFSARKRYPAFMTVVFTILLSVSLNHGLSLALSNMKTLPSSQLAPIEMGEKGLILSNSLNRHETAIILLNGMAEQHGPRVISMPGRLLSYHESSAGMNIAYPPVPFANRIPLSIDNISRDLIIHYERLQNLLNEGLIPHVSYVFSLVFMLCSLSFLFKLSVWPLANLFLGFLVFRGILSVENFLNSREIREVLVSFAGSFVPADMIIPGIFFVFGTLVYIYSILVFITRKRGADEI